MFRAGVLPAFLIALSVSSGSLAQDFTCVLGDRERRIDVVFADPPRKVPCEVRYTKAGQVQSLWSAQHRAGYCESRAREFADRHRSWGWECREDTADGADAGGKLDNPVQ
ncbi:hypothetical protein [Microbulbifer sp. M83]|uniref:hypothetical protein n=1 Tax=Microbulbifer sp. M83 TaxID=3118246 RepID=UPI002FE29BAD